MPYMLRPERPEDERAVERLTKKAFDAMVLPGKEYTVEHLLAHKMRKTDVFVPELDYVAAASVPPGTENPIDKDAKDGQVVGSILYSRAKVVDGEGFEHTVLTFGPLSVLPKWQGQGIGGALVRHTANEAGHLGYKAILIFGHPGYYPRFGFRPAAEFGIAAPDGSTPDALMAWECAPGGLRGIHGRFYPAPVYTGLQMKEVMEFNVFLEEQLLGYN